MLCGLFLYGIGIALMVRGAVGVAPWDVLTQGLAARTGWSFGLITNVVGVVVLAAWIPLRQRPGIGTVLNVLVIGPSADLGLHLVPMADQLWLRIVLFAAGLVVVAVATGLYLGARLGPGPRDGLMTGIHAATGRPIWLARTVIEVTVLTAGWLLGGDVGVGTLAFALLIGPLCQRTIPLFAIAASSTPPAPVAAVTGPAHVPSPAAEPEPGSTPPPAVV